MPERCAASGAQRIFISGDGGAMFHQRVIHLAPGGNDFTKGAAKLAAVRFRVKEMTGGLEWWQNKEGYPVAMGPAPGGL